MSATNTFTTDRIKITAGDIKIILDRYEKDIEWIHEGAFNINYTILIGKRINGFLLEVSMTVENIQKILRCDFKDMEDGSLKDVSLHLENDKQVDYIMDLIEEYSTSLGKWIDCVDDLYEPETGIIKMKGFDTVLELMEDVLLFFNKNAKSYEVKRDFWLMHYVIGEFDMALFRETLCQRDIEKCNDCGCEKQIKSVKELWEELLPTSMHEEFFSGKMMEPLDSATIKQEGAMG